MWKRGFYDDKRMLRCFGGDFDGVMKRLIDENRVERFALKFLDESSMKQLRISLIEDDQESAFRAAHTIKGICQNLGFTHLGNSSGALTEYLRKGLNGNWQELLHQTEMDYREVIDALKQLEDSYL